MCVLKITCLRTSIYVPNVKYLLPPRNPSARLWLSDYNYTAVPSSFSVAPSKSRHRTFCKKHPEERERWTRVYENAGPNTSQCPLGIFLVLKSGKHTTAKTPHSQKRQSSIEERCKYFIPINISSRFFSPSSDPTVWYSLQFFFALTLSFCRWPWICCIHVPVDTLACALLFLYHTCVFSPSMVLCVCLRVCCVCEEDPLWPGSSDKEHADAPSLDVLFQVCALHAKHPQAIEQ